MSSEEQLGEQLKNRRQELNISLKEVENATSIKMGYLNYLEQGNTDQLISPIYAQGFLKQYALFLGLDGEQMLKDHPNLFENSLKSQEFDYGIGTLEVRDIAGSGTKRSFNILFIFVILAALAVGWYIYSVF